MRGQYAITLNMLQQDVRSLLHRAVRSVRGVASANPSLLMIHVPKCAGVSVREALRYSYSKHRLFCDVPQEEKQRAERIVFCTRDPFDRIVSMFHYLRAIESSTKGRGQIGAFKTPASFTEFVHSPELEQLEAHHRFYRSQFDYLKGIEAYRSAWVHLRFEHLAEDMERNFNISLPHRNASARPDNGENIDTPENRERVRIVYRADYDALPSLLR